MARGALIHPPRFLPAVHPRIVETGRAEIKGLDTAAPGAVKSVLKTSLAHGKTASVTLQKVFRLLADAADHDTLLP